MKAKAFAARDRFIEARGEAPYEIMFLNACNILDHFQRALGVLIQRTFNGHFALCHFVEASEIEVAQFCSLIPFIKAKVVFVRRLGNWVGDPRQIFT